VDPKKKYLTEKLHCGHSSYIKSVIVVACSDLNHAIYVRCSSPLSDDSLNVFTSSLVLYSLLFFLWMLSSVPLAML